MVPWQRPDESALSCIAKPEARGNGGFHEHPRGGRPSTTAREPGLRLESVIIKHPWVQKFKLLDESWARIAMTLTCGQDGAGHDSLLYNIPIIHDAIKTRKIPIAFPVVPVPLLS